MKVPIKDRNKNEMIKSLRDFLLITASRGRTVIIIVDEAQDLSDDTLEELRLLSNLETEKEKLVQIVLIGQPELKERLSSDRLRQLNQRMTVKTALRPLGRQETFDYINYRPMKAGKGPPAFEEKAKDLIYRYSKGVPRIINVVASRSLMAAYIDGTTDIKKRHVRYAIDHLSGTDEPVQSSRIYWKYAAMALLAIALGVAGVTGYKTLSPGRNVERAQEPVKAGATAMPLGEAVASSGDTGTHHVVVTVRSATLRQEPSRGSNPMTYVSQGTLLKVRGSKVAEDGIGWYRVELSDGRDCWISAKVVRPE